MKKLLSALLVSACLVGGASSAVAEDAPGKLPLDEAFDRLVIVPFDFHGKVFVSGEKTDILEPYDMVQKDGRVLVPIRLMGYLASEVDRGGGYWEVRWDQQRPNDVVLVNHGSGKTIRFTVNSRTMVVNGEPVAMDVAPQKVDGRIVLPLRSAAEALDKKIDWLDGLILLGDVSVDLQHPQTTAVKSPIKTQLTDARKPKDDATPLNPIARYGNATYYTKITYRDNGVTEELYRKPDGQKETKVQVPGTPAFSNAQVIGDELYYVTATNDGYELQALRFADRSSRKIVALEQWSPADGWLAGVMKLDNELYVNLHYGDLTMGAERLYKVEQGALKEVLGAKQIVDLTKDGEHIYFADFRFMGMAADNLYRLNAATGEKSLVGEEGFVYGIYRDVRDDGVSYGASGPLYVKDGYLYTLGFKEDDLQDRGAVYRIDPESGSQVVLTSPAKQFWIVDDRIFYIDAETGHLKQVGLDGTGDRTLAARKVGSVQIFNGNLYYLTVTGGRFSHVGELYKYNIAGGQETKLSDKPASSFYAGTTGVYYVSRGYEPGLYKIDANGRNVALVNDDIAQAQMTDAGMIYTLIYKEGVFAAK